MAAPTKRPRLCIVGLGGRGLKLLAHLAARPEQWEVAAVADRSAVAYARLEFELYDRRVHAVREAVDLLPLEPDAIIVSTTASAHVPVALELIERGYAGALLIEKPLAASVAAGRELDRLTRSWPGRAAVGFQRRGSRMYAEAARLLAGGSLGEVRSIRYATAIPSQISMKGSHHFDLANWFAGAEPVSVSARLDRHSAVDRRGAYYVDPPGAAEVAYASGTVFRMDLTGAGAEPGLVVECEHGRLTVGPEEDAIVVHGPEGERSIASDGDEGSFEWFDATLQALTIGGNGVAPCTVAEAETDLEVVAAAFLSNARGGDPVRLPLEADGAAVELRIA